MKLLKYIGIGFIAIIRALVAIVFSPIWILLCLMSGKSLNGKYYENKFRSLLRVIFSDGVVASLSVDRPTKSHALIEFRYNKCYSEHTDSDECNDTMPDFVHPEYCHRISDKIFLYDNPDVNGVHCWFCYNRYAYYYRTMMFIGNPEKCGTYFKEKLAEETGLHLSNEARTIGYIDYSTMQLAGEYIYFDLESCEIESLKTQLENLCEHGIWERTENGYRYHDSRNCGMETLTVEYTPGQRFLEVNHFRS